MTSQIKLLSQKNLQEELKGIEYPDHVTLKGKAINYFAKTSPVINTLNEIAGRQNEMVLNHNLFLEGDPTFWKVMLHLLFPYEVPRKYDSHRLFLFTPDGNYYINPTFHVTIDDIRQVIDYLLIGNPRDMEAIITHFVYDRPGAPKQPKNAKRVNGPPRKQSKEYPQQENNVGYSWATNGTNDRNAYSNENNYENENNVEIGFKNEEEEEVYKRLSVKNFAKYKPQGGHRKTRKLNKKSRARTPKWIR